jgi:hypothetical protein
VNFLTICEVAGVLAGAAVEDGADFLALVCVAGCLLKRGWGVLLGELMGRLGIFFYIIEYCLLNYSITQS